MKVELWPVEKITPYEKNPRKNDKAVDVVAESIRKFGFRQPVVVDDDGVIVVGHTRWKAAQKLELKKVPVHVAVGMSPEDAQAYRIADNKTNELAEWDFDLLPAELAELKGAGYDLSLLGFDGDELSKLMDSGVQDGLCDPDAVPEPPDKAITQPGDLWILGEHRLLCGDSTSPGDVQRLLDGNVPEIMVTDPPYGVEYDPTWRKDAGINKNRKKMGTVQNDNTADWSAAWSLFNGDVAYVYHAGVFASTVQHSLEQAGFDVRAQIIWAKDRMALSRGDYHWQHEPCWYAVRKGKRANRTKDRTQTTLWSIPARDDSGHGHGTQKPVECMRRPIQNHKVATVYEPFAGSGTTMIACEQLRRRCFAMEIAPPNCDVIIERYEKFTGKKAERISGNTPAEEKARESRAGKVMSK